MLDERSDTMLVEDVGHHVDPSARAATAPVTLVQFPPVWGRNVSPFTLKLETWLKLAEIPYTVRHSTDLGKAPKRKLPFIEDGLVAIGDSSLIIEHLKATRGIDPDAGLSDRERSEALALQRMFEDHFYYVLMYSRWIDPEGWASVSEGFFASFPAPLRPFGRMYMRRRIRRLLHDQGLGRHHQREIYAMGRDDLQAAADYLGDRPFFLGDRLTTMDAVAFGFLANVLLVPVETELKRSLQDLPNLVAWVESMEAGLAGD
jgi:glutathione S-transferase